jgi:hydrogenase maturation protein HypF
MIKEILKEQSKEVAVSKFFNTIIEIIKTIYADFKNYPLVVSGGVFQNSVLVGLLLEQFENIYIPSKIPPNDGSIALGQLLFRE